MVASVNRSGLPRHLSAGGYGVSPKATAGWLARVQQLADVVAAQGSVDVSLFATDGKSE